MSTRRREMLYQYLSENGEARFQELCTLFPDFSSMTIRRDLEDLEMEGKIQRFRGGARILNQQASLKEVAYAQRLVANIKEKRRIAEKALPFIQEAKSIYIDSGTTCVQLATAIGSESLFVLTPAPYVAIELINRPNIRVNLTGGQLSHDSLCLSGGNALAYVKNLNIDLAFIGASACSLNNAFTCGDYQEAELKKAIIKKAQKVICLMDSSKLNFSLPYTFAKFRDIHVLITERLLPESYQRVLKRNQVRLI